MDEHQLLLWLVPALATVLSAIGFGIWGELREVRKSIQALALSNAVVVERVNGHEMRIERLEEVT